MAHYEDPLAVRYERINISINAYQMAAIRKTCRAFHSTKADLLYRWTFEPESKFSEQSRAYFYEILDSVGGQDIRVCA